MNILKRLQTILGPSRSPANHSRRHPAIHADPEGQSFAGRLRTSADAGAIGSQQPATPAVIAASEPLNTPAVPAAAPQSDQKPAADAAPPAAAANPVVASLAETLAQAVRAAVAPAAPPSGIAPAVTAKFTAAASAPAAPPASVEWAPMVVNATGSREPGVARSDDVVRATFEFKFQQYTNPQANAVLDIGEEGRMFLYAVGKGVVPKTPAFLRDFFLTRQQAEAGRVG